MPGFTDEQKAELGEMLKASIGELLAPALKDAETRFGKMANGAALTAAEKATKGLREQLSGVPTQETLAETIKASVTEMLAAHAPAAPAKGAGDGESEAMKELRKKLEASDKRQQSLVDDLKKKDIEQQAILDKQRRTEERQTLTAALEKAGVKTTLRAAAVALLTERGLVKRDQDGNILFDHKDKDGNVEALPVEAGIGKWVATDEGKEYLPPKDAGGSGDRGAGRGGTGNTGKSQFEINKANMLAGLRGAG